MADAEKQVNGIEAINDDQLDAVAGGANFKLCKYGRNFESEFPEMVCKNCPEFQKEKFDKGEAKKKYKFYCDIFKRTEWKNADVWGFF